MVFRNGRGRRGGDKWKAKGEPLEAGRRHDVSKGQIALARQFKGGDGIFVRHSNGRLGLPGIVDRVDHRVHVRHAHRRGTIDYHPANVILATQV